jgi:hypothetical protein
VPNHGVYDSKILLQYLTVDVEVFGAESWCIRQQNSSPIPDCRRQSFWCPIMLYNTRQHNLQIPGYRRRSFWCQIIGIKDNKILLKYLTIEVEVFGAESWCLRQQNSSQIPDYRRRSFLCRSWQNCASASGRSGQLIDTQPPRREGFNSAVVNTSVSDPHWFQCGSRSRVLMTKKQGKKLQLNKKNILLIKNCNLLIPRSP